MSNATALRSNVTVSIPRAPALPSNLFKVLTFEVLTQDFSPMPESAKFGRQVHIAALIDSTLTEMNAPIMLGRKSPVI